MRRLHCPRPVAGSSNGRTPDSGSGSWGSNPCPAASRKPRSGGVLCCHCWHPVERRNGTSAHFCPFSALDKRVHALARIPLPVHHFAVDLECEARVRVGPSAPSHRPESHPPRTEAHRTSAAASGSSPPRWASSPPSQVRIRPSDRRPKDLPRDVRPVALRPATRREHEVVRLGERRVSPLELQLVEEHRGRGQPSSPPPPSSHHRCVAARLRGRRHASGER